MFAPEEMLLVAGSPSLRREALDRLAGQRSPAYARDLATYGRALQQRNGLLRLIREEQATRAELRFWDATLLEVGHGRPRGAPAPARRARRAAGRGPRGDRARRGRGRPARPSAYATNAPQQPGESVRDALARRLAETAEKEAWNGTTLIGPHRDDLVFEMARPAARLVRVAGPAADGDPRVQAGRGGPADGARRPPAAAPPRRRVQRARSGAAVAPRPADRRPAPGVRHDDDARRPRPRAPLGRARPGPSRPARTAPRGWSAGREPVGRRPRPAPAIPSRPGAGVAPTGSATCSPRRPASWASRTSSGSPGRSRPGTPSSPSACPTAVGACRLVRVEPDAVVVAVDEPIVAAELRMRALELLGAFGTAPGGARVRLLRLVGGAGRRLRGLARDRAYNPCPACRRGMRHARIPARVAHIHEAPVLAVRLQLKLGAVTEQDRLADSPDTIVVVEPSVGSVGSHQGATSTSWSRARSAGNRAREATRMVADTIRNEYYYDESAGIRQCLIKVLGIANKRLAHQRDRYGLGSADGAGTDRRRGRGGAGPRDVRGDGRAGRGLPDPPGPPLDPARTPTRSAGLPAAELEPEVWRGELQVGDSLCLVSANVVARIGTDALKDALVTLHPQSAIEHLHARFAAADGARLGRRGRVRGERGRRDLQGQDARPGPPRRAARRRPGPRPDPARRLRGRCAPRPWAPGPPRPGTRPATASSGSCGGSRTCCPRRKPGSRKVTDRDQPDGDAAPGGDRHARVHRGRRRARPGRLRRRRPAVAHPAARLADRRPAGVPRRPQAAVDEVIGDGVDLIRDDQRRALELLSVAYAKLDEAAAAGYPDDEVEDLRAEVTRRPRPAVRRRPGPVEHRVHVPGRHAGPAGVAGPRRPDGAPYVLDSAGKTVWRIDLADGTAKPVAAAGDRVSGVAGRRPPHPRGGRPGRARSSTAATTCGAGARSTPRARARWSGPGSRTPPRGATTST